MNQKNHKQHFILRLLFILMTLIIVLSPFSLTVSARSINQMNQAQILEESETINGPGFFSGDVVQIDGTVNGTTFASGSSVLVNGTINGSLFAAGQTVVINGEVTGNIYGAAQTITLTGQNEGDSFLAGATVTIDSQADLGRDLFIAGSSLIQAGTVTRHLYGAGEQFTLNGIVGGDAALDITELTLNNSSVIEGNLTYRSPNEANINTDAAVNGQVDWQQIRPNEQPSRSDRIIRMLLKLLWSILSALLVWLFFKIWRPNLWMHVIQPIAAAPVKTIGVGLAALIGAPLLAVLLLFTIIGIPLALILAAIYAVCLYLAKIVLAVFIGSWLAKQFHWSRLKREIWLALLGLVILELAGLIPYAGFFISLLVLIVGLGALVLSFYRRNTSEPPASN